MTTTGSTAAVSGETFDLGDKLRLRLRETNAQKERTQLKINQLNDQLQKMFAKTPKRPRESSEQMDENIAKLEYQRTTTSLKLAEEKKILRQIDVIKRTKTQLQQYKEYEKAIQDKKSEIASLRDLLRTTIAAVAELESALSKVDLAKRLGCTTAELQTRVVDCPQGKLGRVIGKNGIALKQLEERTGVHIDVDKVGSKIHLHGSDAALDAAVEEVENITLAIEEELELPVEVVSYLLANRSSTLVQLRKDYPMVHIDLSRESNKVHLRGRPKHVSTAKEELLGLGITKKSRTLTSRETSLVVGKGGATISKLIESHNVVINVSSSSDGEESSAEIIGPLSNVDAAFADVERILHENEEIEESIVVGTMVRNKLLANSGAAMKALQAEISTSIQKNGSSVFLLFEKRSKDDLRSDSNLIIKANRTNMPIAKEIVSRRINEVEETVLCMTVDPNLIPTIIGKGGVTINSLRETGGPGTDIDVDKGSGRIRIRTEDPDTRAAVAKQIEKIVAENQTLTVDIDSNLIGIVFGEPGKDMRKNVTETIGAWIGVDSADTHITLRGTTEQIHEAAALVRAFISENFIEECDIDPEDEITLLVGGADSYLQKLENDHDVKAILRKATHELSIRGNQENVEAAIKAVNLFLYGGDGFAVCKVKIPEGVLGVVIGKGGTNLAKLEKEYEGVSVQVHRNSNFLSIRGPEDMVSRCRINVITTVFTAKVNDTIFITSEQHETLSQPDALKKVNNIMGLSVVLTENSVKLRGFATDVRDAKCMLHEQLTGKYETVIDLDAPQLSKVKAAARDPSHFERIRDSTKATVSLDTSLNAIVISGKRSNVKKAKNLVMGFLDFLLPSEFAKLKVAKPMLKPMGDVSTLGEISAESGATLAIDRDLSAIQVRSSNPENVQKAMDLLKAKLIECEKLNLVVRLDGSESWLLPIIIGKGGVSIQKLQKDTECRFDVSREDLTIAISGDSEDTVSKAKSAFDELVAKARRECVFIDIPESAMPNFIGKSGAHIKQLADDHGVEIERLRKDPMTVRIQGDEESVQAATEAVTNWLQDWESKHIGKSISVEEAVIPALIGKDGSVVSAIQKETGCRIDINRHALSLTVRGGNDSQQDDALRRIEVIISEEKVKALERAAVRDEQLKEKAARQEQLIKEKSEESKSNWNPTADAQGNTRAPTSTQRGHQVTCVESRKDRSSEFQARPVGLTIVESNKKKPNGPKKQRKSKKGNVSGNGANGSGPEAPKEGTAAGRGLFELLVSDPSPTDTIGFSSKNELSPSALLSSTVTDEQWDSSTVSSAAVSSGSDSTDEESHGEGNVLMDKSYYKSTSGFTVRV